MAGLKSLTPNRIFLATLALVFNIICVSEGYTCGHDKYNPAHKHCCDTDHGLFPVPKTEFDNGMKCCRDGKHGSKDGEESRPTGLIDPNHQICCGGKPHQKFPGIACCGTASYNENTQECCYHGKPALANKGKEKCCGDKVISNESGCCNSLWKMAPDQICCEQYGPKMVTEPGQDACCEDRFVSGLRELYNGTTHKCKGGKVVPRTNIADKGKDTESHTTSVSPAFKVIDMLTLRDNPEELCKSYYIFIGRLEVDDDGITRIIRRRKRWLIVKPAGHTTDVPQKLIVPIINTNFLEGLHIFFMEESTLKGDWTVVVRVAEYNKYTKRKLKNECKRVKVTTSAVPQPTSSKMTPSFANKPLALRRSYH